MATSANARTIVELRSLGYLAAVVERFNTFAKIRVDLFGCVDVLGLPPDSDEPALFVQATTAHNLASHASALVQSLAARRIVATNGCAFELWSWAKRGARGSRKLWTVVRYRAKLGPAADAIYFERLRGGDDG